MTNDSLIGAWRRHEEEPYDRSAISNRLIEALSWAGPNWQQLQQEGMHNIQQYREKGSPPLQINIGMLPKNA